MPDEAAASEMDAATEDQQATTEAEQQGDGKSEIDAIRAALKKANREAASDRKAKAELEQQLEEFRKGQMSEQEKAIAEARAEARAAALSEIGSDLVRAKLEAALTGVVDDPAGLIDDVNLSKFLDKDGKPDQSAIDALRSKWQKTVPKGATVPNGKRGDGGRLTEDQFARLTPQQKSDAWAKGEADHLMQR